MNIQITFFWTADHVSVPLSTEYVGIPRRGDIIRWELGSIPAGTYRVSEVVWRYQTIPRIEVFLEPEE